MNTLTKKASILSLSLLVLASCSKDKVSVPDTGNSGNGDRYFVAAVKGGTYAFAVDNLEKDTTWTTSTAFEDQFTYSHYASNGTNAVFSVSYQKGQPAPVSVYQLNSQGVLKKTAESSVQSGFNAIGAFSHYLFVLANNKTVVDANNNSAPGTTVNVMDLNNQPLTNSVQGIATTGIVPNTTAQLLGITDAGDGTFYSPLALTAIEGTTAPASGAYIAKVGEDLKVQKVITTTKIGSPNGANGSTRWSLLGNDDNGNTYAFYGTASSATEPRKAAVMRINKGAGDFDASYYFDIETASGGVGFTKMTHITGDYFLLQMAAAASSGYSTPSSFAVVNVNTQKFTWVTGLPASVTDAATNVGWVLAANNKAYIPLTTPDADPTIYYVDPSTAVAKKGITVSGVTSVSGLAKLSPQQNF